jgi:Spx/MgsR family transcriptional regulator
MATVQLTLYVIANCDTAMKARRWLRAQIITYRFHDYHKAGIEEATLGRWITACGWAQLLNRHGTTWRNLSQTIRHNIDEASAAELMLVSW